MNARFIPALAFAALLLGACGAEEDRLLGASTGAAYGPELEDANRLRHDVDAWTVAGSALR